MRGIKGLTLAAVATLILALSAAPAEAQLQIRPGGTYTVVVTITKPSDMKFDAGTWEVRAYFYQGGDCFNKGEWWLPTGAIDYLYTGWWEDRYPLYGAKRSQAWDKPDSREHSITVDVVSRPRENPKSPDNKQTQAELPTSPDNLITLRVRFRIKGIDPRMEDDKVSFTIGGARYAEKITRRYRETVYIRGGKIDLVDKDLDVDVDSLVSVRDDALSPATFSVSVSIPAWERAVEIPWLLIGGTVAALAVVGVLAVLAVRKRRAARELPPPPPPPPGF